MTADASLWIGNRRVTITASEMARVAAALSEVGEGDDWRVKLANRVTGDKSMSPQVAALVILEPAAVKAKIEELTRVVKVARKTPARQKPWIMARCKD